MAEASVAGAAADQLAGTDRPPTADASPRPAVTAPPKPHAVAEPTERSASTKPAPAPSGDHVGCDGGRRHRGAGNVCAYDTAVGMALPTNQAAVTPIC